MAATTRNSVWGKLALVLGISGLIVVAAVVGLVYLFGWGHLSHEATSLLSSDFLPLAIPLTLGALMSVPVATLTVRILPNHLMRPIVGIATTLLGLWMVCKLTGLDALLWQFITA